jgi:hypothetical protein
MFFEYFEDEEFDKHLEEIETVPISDTVVIPLEKGPVGRHPQEPKRTTNIKRLGTARLCKGIINSIIILIINFESCLK